MWQYVIFLSLKPTKGISDFILNYLKKVIGGATTQKLKKNKKKHDIFYMDAPPGPPGVSKDVPSSTKQLLVEIWYPETPGVASTLVKL
jgi:hypothetical protein